MIGSSGINGCNSARAVLRKVRVSPQKLNLVTAMIKGMRVDRAMGVLIHSRKRIASDVYKTLKSAVANAEQKSLNADSLYVQEAYVGYSMKLRRFHARGRGRSGTIIKPFSHLTIVVSQR